ncbi:hypothetical protein MAF45_07930 [Mesosutterella sp. OilRF-GAM-744-9]|uniref:Uncharacterized protein n=1 Tax=Mesosutterella porci TaxID=2915351 RepID=A0ABS9MS67_9BURK|nr:hypothetical protein [Mesosutterella sp. oilRF-744-WT-GAM-9]MCG5031367.1 hypothetical protein [Mesosutterella sp. oilRF-744-WT-GAM-9]
MATYPIWTYFSLPRSDIAVIAVGLIIAAFLRILDLPSVLTAFITMYSALIGIAAAVTQSVTVLKFWPVGVYILVFIALFIGLGHDDGMVCKAISKGKAPDDPLRAYSRALSIVWMCFFALIGAVGALTCFWGNMKSWVFWNGLMSWALGLIFWVTEKLARNFILKDLRRQAEAGRKLS